MSQNYVDKSNVRTVDSPKQSTAPASFCHPPPRPFTQIEWNACSRFEIALNNKTIDVLSLFRVRPTHSQWHIGMCAVCCVWRSVARSAFKNKKDNHPHPSTHIQSIAHRHALSAFVLWSQTWNYIVIIIIIIIIIVSRAIFMHSIVRSPEWTVVPRMGHLTMGKT